MFLRFASIGCVKFDSKSQPKNMTEGQKKCGLVKRFRVFQSVHEVCLGRGDWGVLLFTGMISEDTLLYMINVPGV